MQCPSCGNQNEPGATFCDQCGTSLGGVAASVAPAIMPSSPMPSGGGNICPSCQSPVIPGEMFCDNCGAQLSGAAPVAAPMPNVQPAYVPPPQPSYSPPTPSYQPPPPQQAMPGQLIAANGQSYPLAGKSVYVIGREDAVSGIYPDVDTTTSGGEQSGVSRRHAEIHQNGMQWSIRDLNSTNGTQVNNQKLPAGGQQPLNRGDQIRLGSWLATFQG